MKNLKNKSKIESTAFTAWTTHEQHTVNF
jgi:hypothetical protein